MKSGNLLHSAILVALSCVSCNSNRTIQKTDEELKQLADTLAIQDLIVDGHIDLPDRLIKRKRPDDALKAILLHTSEGDFDVDRAQKGGLDAPFMSIYIPSTYQKGEGMAKSYADSLINLVQAMPRLLPGQFAPASSPDDVRMNSKAGKISLPMGMENGAPIGEDLRNIEYFFKRGIRYITLTHGKFNLICGSSGDTTNTHTGLTAFGREVVLEMNRVGIMVDISHVDDSTFYQVMRLTSVPCIASHSSCRYFAPKVKRDLSDDMILRLGKNGGVVLINFYTQFIDSVAYRQGRIFESSLKLKGLKMADSSARPLIEQFRKDHPVDIEVVTDHIDHVVELIGIDHVGLGSDFDGVDGSLPVGLTDVSMYPHLIYSLLRRGYSEKDIEKIVGGNFMRVWQQSLDAAKR